MTFKSRLSRFSFWAYRAPWVLILSLHQAQISFPSSVTYSKENYTHIQTYCRYCLPKFLVSHITTFYYFLHAAEAWAPSQLAICPFKMIRTHKWGHDLRVLSGPPLCFRCAPALGYHHVYDACGGVEENTRNTEMPLFQMWNIQEASYTIVNVYFIFVEWTSSLN